MAAHLKKIIISAVLSLSTVALTVFYPFSASGSPTVNAQTQESFSAAAVSGGELPIQPGVTAETPEYDFAFYQKAAENEDYPDVPDPCGQHPASGWSLCGHQPYCRSPRRPLRICIYKKERLLIAASLFRCQEGKKGEKGNGQFLGEKKIM